MKNEKEKLADDLMKEGFAHHEVPFEPMAWDKMKALLDEDDDLKPLLMVPENKSNRKHFLTILIIMTTLSLLSVATWIMFSPKNEIAGNINKGSVVHSGTEITRSLENEKDFSVNGDLKSEALDLNSAFLDESSENKTELNRNKAAVLPNTSSEDHASSMTENPNDKNKTNPQNANSSENKDAQKYDGFHPVDSVVSVLKDGKIHRVLIRKTWIPDEYHYVEIDSLKSVQDGFIGVHFTAQKPANVDSMSAGFNIQFMSGNRLEHAYWGLYGGFDWGMQFYGKSKKSGVVLNNTRQDSGFTRLRSQSMDFFGRAHLEYARFPIIPYFNAMAGPRLYYTNQHVASYVPLKETESSSTTNAHTSVSMMYGVGAGIRVRVSKVVSLDMRYEWMSGTKVKQVDLNNSTFNGLNYNLVYTKARPTVEQFKFGLLFDLSSKEYKKELVKPGYYKETVYDSLILDPSDSNTIILPCNCKPCDNSADYRPRENNDEDVYTPDNGSSSGKNNGSRNNSGSGSSGSGKGSFPGIRPPAPKPNEKPN
jgi:hypothetical protein